MAAPKFLPFKVLRRTAGSLRASANAGRTRESGVKRAIDRADQVLSSLGARAAGFDRAIKALQIRKKHALARAGLIEERMLELMSEAGLDKLVGNRATLSKRGNALSLLVDDLKLIPAAYLRTRTTSEADKLCIKCALDRGRRSRASISPNRSRWCAARKLILVSDSFDQSVIFGNHHPVPNRGRPVI